MLDFRIECTQDRINLYKRYKKIFLAVIIITASIICYDAYVLQTHELNKFILICIGLLIGNIFWLSIDVLSFKNDIKIDLKSLEYLKKMENDDLYINFMRGLQDAKINYEESKKNFDLLTKQYQDSKSKTD